MGVKRVSHISPQKAHLSGRTNYKGEESGDRGVKKNTPGNMAEKRAL